MKTSEAITKRRAIKAFDPNHVMSDDDKHTLLSLALLAPTAFNIQNWRLIVVDDDQQRERIKEAAGGQEQVTSSSLFIIICADLKSWEKNPQRYWVNAPTEVQNYIIPAIDGFYRGKDQVQRDEALRSSGIIAQTLMLAAQDLGYQSCPMIGFDFAKVGALINLPKDHVVSMFVAIGKGIKEPYPRGGQLAMDEVVFYNTF